jgi:hypothetical protein
MIEDVFHRVRAADKPQYEFRPFGARPQQLARTISVLEAQTGAMLEQIKSRAKTTTPRQ